MASARVFRVCRVCGVWDEMYVETRASMVGESEVMELESARVTRRVAAQTEYSHNGHGWREPVYEGWLIWRV
ncbi:MAG: hypothetical protein QXD32_06690 [Nitrososphaerota archaeon]